MQILNGKKMEGMICDMTGKEVKKMFMCPCRVKLTEKFVCDKDCIYCSKKYKVEER